MDEYIVWECYTVRNGFKVEAESAEDAIKILEQNKYSHYKTEDWKYSHREIEKLGE